MRFCWPCIDYNYFYSYKTSIRPVPTSTSPAWTVLVYALPYPSCTPIFCALSAQIVTPYWKARAQANTAVFSGIAFYGPAIQNTVALSPLGRTTGAGHSCHRFRLLDRRASSTFSGPVRRSWADSLVRHIFHTVGATALLPPPHPCEGGEKKDGGQVVGIYLPVLLYHNIQRLSIVYTQYFVF